MKILKKITAVCCVLFLFAGNVYADAPTVTFDGDAASFVYNVNANSFGDAFDGIAPGETRTQTFMLKNTANDQMQFYFTAEAVEDFSQAIGAAYEISFSRDGSLFYDGTLGGENGTLTNLEVGNSGTSAAALTDRLLIASLAKGESQEISMNLTLDGTSTGNDYQNKAALFHFTFTAAYDNAVTTTTTTTTVPGQTIVQKVTKTETSGTQTEATTTSTTSSTTSATRVKTSDETKIWIPIVGMTMAVAIGICLVTVRKKEKK